MAFDTPVAPCALFAITHSLGEIRNEGSSEPNGDRQRTKLTTVRGYRGRVSQRTRNVTSSMVESCRHLET